MKKLEELGISPAPWKFKYIDHTVADVKCAYKGIARKRLSRIVVHDAYLEDALLIAAAPKLYTALFEAIGDCIDCTSNCSGCLNSKSSWIKNAKAALAEASGESVK